MADPDPARELAVAFLDGRLRLPQFDRRMEQICARVNLVCVVSPDLGYRPLDGEGIVEFLTHSLVGIVDEDAARTVNLNAALGQWLGAERLGWLDEIVPASLPLPDGSKTELRYSLESDPRRGTAASPECEVALASVLDWKFHPFVCEGLAAVQLNLLDPAGSRLATVFDLPGFLKRELPGLLPRLRASFPDVAWDGR